MLHRRVVDFCSSVIFARQLETLPRYNSDKEIKELIDPAKWNLGLSPDEITFNKWCLDNCLFFNPLNDLEVGVISAKDVFHLPNHSYPLLESPRFVQYFDLLKQEYVSARALYFEFLTGNSADYAYKNNLQFVNFDNSLYGFKCDKLKLAFRSSYSTFDKLAVFINEYMGLEKNISRVSFRSVWYQMIKRR